MPLSARQKAVLAITLLIVGGLVYAFVVECVPLLNTVTATAYEVSSMEDKLNGLKLSFHNYPMPQQYLDELKPIVGDWENTVNLRARRFTSTLRTVPAAVQTPGFYFDEELGNTHRRLADKSRQTRIPIPPDLGIAAGIPAPDLVEILLNQMSNGEYVLNLAMDCGVTAVSNLVIGLPVEQNGFINLIPIQISFEASLDALKKFLLECSNGPQYVNVKDIALRPVRDVFGGTSFSVDLSLVTTWVALNKDATEPAPAGAARGFPGRRGYRGMRPGMRRFGPRGAPGAPGAPGAAPTGAGTAAAGQ